MRTQLFLSFVAVAAIAGCGKSGGKGGNDAGPPPVDMADVPPAPVATHVGATGNTAAIQSDGAATHVAYLLNVAPVNAKVDNKYSVPMGSFGELHVASSDGTDTVVNPSILQGSYVMAPDGKSLYYTVFDLTTSVTTGAVSVNRFDTTTKTSSVVSATGGLSQFLGQTPPPANTTVYQPIPLNEDLVFFTPSGKYFLIGVLAPGATSAPDTWILDVATGAPVIKIGGGQAYEFLDVTPDDTLIFANSINGTVTGTTPPANPVQQLFWQPISATSTATMITSRVAQSLQTADSKNLVIMTTAGDISTFDLTTHKLSAAPLASGATQISVGSDSKGPIAYVGSDLSVHVIDTTGAKLLDIDAATAKASLANAPIISQDNGHLYFWQSDFLVHTKSGTLMHAAIKSGSTATKVGDSVSLPDLRITDSALVFLQHVDATGTTGDVYTSNLDGSSPVALGMKANTGGLQLINPVAKSWYAIHLTGATADATNVPIVGTPTTGALSLSVSGATTDTVLDSTVGASQYAFSDDGHDVIYVSKASWYSPVANYVGTLELVDLRTPATPIPGGVAGVTELGPVSNRALFVNAPAASPAGVYYIKY